MPDITARQRATSIRISMTWVIWFVAGCMVANTVDIGIQGAASLWLRGLNPADAWRHWGWGLGEWITRSSICPAAALLGTVLPFDRRRLGSAGIHLVAPIILAPIALALSFPFVWPTYSAAISPMSAFAELASRYYLPTVVLYWITVGILLAVEHHNRYVGQLQEAARLERRSMQLEASLNKTQLEALKSKVHPHFIFNTLNALTVLARDGKLRAVVQTTTRLGKLFRAAVADESAVASVAAELRLVRDYLYIERMRFGNRLVVHWRISADALHAEAPRFSVQPLVENAIKHGVSSTSGQVVVEVGAATRDGRTLIWVQDSGAGLPLQDVKEGFGLSNIRKRLEYLYGQDQSLRFSGSADGGVRVELSIPSSAASC